MVKGTSRILARTIESESDEISVDISGAFYIEIANEGQNSLQVEFQNGIIEILPEKSKIFPGYPSYPIVQKMRFIFDQITTASITQIVIAEQVKHG